MDNNNNFGNENQNQGNDNVQPNQPQDQNQNNQFQNQNNQFQNQNNQFQNQNNPYQNQNNPYQNQNNPYQNQNPYQNNQGYQQQNQGNFYQTPPYAQNGEIVNPEAEQKAKSSKGFGIAALIISIVCCGGGILSIIFAIIALTSASKSTSLNNGVALPGAKTGKICAIISFVAFAVFMLMSAIFSASILAYLENLM